MANMTSISPVQPPLEESPTYLCYQSNYVAQNVSTNGSSPSATQFEISLPPPPDVMTLPDIMVRTYVCVCAFGILGNTLALILLFHRKRKMAKRRHGRTADSRSGCKSDVWCFIMLSLSDMMFCIMLIPQWNTSTNVMIYTSRSVMFFYERFEGALINTFVLSSTWLTVSMTVNRYLHLSHPIWAMRYLGRHFLTSAIIVSIIFSVLFNIPRFWFKEVHQYTCTEPTNTSLYFVMPPADKPQWETGYHWSYFVLGIMVPLCSLVYSNGRIIHAMCQSLAIEQTRNKERNLITRTLIIVVIFYVVLVSPTELIKFFEVNSQSYVIAVSIANLLQAINFSCNFLPYLILDKSVRRNIFNVRCRGSLRYEAATTSVTGNDTIHVRFNNGHSINSKRNLVTTHTTSTEMTAFTTKGLTYA